jgi:phosphatidylserine/phosphatidylglycerophosphate/cardiolipin synthase-like enzyme
VVDRRLWFVTSANFTKRGHTRNMEMGALIEDPERASEVVAVFEEWAGAGVFRRVG